MLKNILLVFLVILTFSACGGGSSADGNAYVESSSKSESMTIDWDFTSSNTITTSSSLFTNITIDDGVINIANITSDYNVVLGGDDALLFDLITTTKGQTLSFKQKINYDIPLDTYQDNTYKIELKMNHDNGYYNVLITFEVERYVIKGNYSKVSKTGQSISVIDYDDAYYEKGIDSNFTRSNEMVTDNLSSLIWQDNNETIDVTKAVDFSTAPPYCADLTLGGLTWRVPTVRELNSITNYSTTESTKINQAFVYRDSVNNYMSSDDYNSTHSFRYTNKSAISAIVENGAGALIRCVSGTNSLIVLPGNLSRDNTLQVVTDSTNNLIWQDNFDTQIYVRTWSESIKYCESLTINGYTDWRLPQIFELNTLINTTSIHSTYWYVSGSPYWSSTLNPTNNFYASTINMSSNALYEGIDKTLEKHARCVRDFQ